MGVKSTVRLSRGDAIDRYKELSLSIERRRLDVQTCSMCNDCLEDALEKLNDEWHHGEGFENYLIRDSN
jgi:hypothetical protein